MTNCAEASFPQPISLSDAKLSAKVPEMVTIKEASSRTGLSYDFLRKSCLQGKIVHIRIGNGKFLINFGMLVEWLNTSCGNDLKKG